MISSSGEKVGNIPIVLYVCTDTEYFAGSSRSLLDMIHALDKRIHPIVLFRESCNVEEIYRKDGVETIICSFSRLNQGHRYKLTRIIKHPINNDLYKDLKQDIKCCQYIKRYLNGRRLSFVHTNVSVTAIGVLISFSMHVPHVWHIREMYRMYASSIGYDFWRRLVNKASVRIFISNAVAESWSTKRYRSYVVYNAVVPSVQLPEIKEKEKIILHCSVALDDRKGVKTAIQGFANSGLYMFGYKLKLIGSCSEDRKQELLNSVNDNSQAIAAIEFVDYTTSVAKYFQRASLFLMCSLNEPLGRTTIEAMYYGCPVIGRASGGTVEIIDDQRTGYLFKRDDELPSLMNKVVTTDQSELLNRAQKEVVERFSCNSFLPKLVEIYDDVLNKQRIKNEVSQKG